MLPLGYRLTPVYRVYNPYNYRQLYTTDYNEYNNLVNNPDPSQRWNDEGIAFYAFVPNT